MPNKSSGEFRDDNILVFKKGDKNAYKLPPNEPFIATNFPKKKDDFHWIYSDEPHTTRRKEILKAHPEIRKLFGTEIKTFYIVMAITLSQIWIASWIGQSSWMIFLSVMYLYGATVNHTLQLANHEISHNLVFRDNINANFLLGIVANLVTGVPSSVTFRYYHMDHHIYQGVDVIDTDIPTDFELITFTNTLTKFIWICLQSIAYAFRPVALNPKPITKYQVFNVVACLLFDIFIYYYCGFWGLIYLILGSFVGLGLHPVAGHFVAEHYEFVNGFETYSYYGIINYLNFNVGYHNEHHDFPKIPWSNLPKVRKIAPEWYDHLPHHSSYIAVIWRYITDPAIGPWSRVKRKTCSKFQSPQRKVHHIGKNY